MCKGSLQWELPDHKRFRNLYWAMKNHERFPAKFKNPRKIYPSALWNQWAQDADLRNYVANTVEYDCFWRKYKREMQFRVMNDSYWIIRSNEYNEEEADIFDLNYLFFENDGDMWKTYDETLEDLLDLNLLFRNFSIRPECDDNCCVGDYGPFQSDYDLCQFCWCCKYLHKFYDQCNETVYHQLSSEI